MQHRASLPSCCILRRVSFSYHSDILFLHFIVNTCRYWLTQDSVDSGSDWSHPSAPPFLPGMGRTPCAAPRPWQCCGGSCHPSHGVTPLWRASQTFPMPFASLTSQLSSAAGKWATLMAGSSRTTNPDRRHGHPATATQAGDTGARPAPRTSFPHRTSAPSHMQGRAGMPKSPGDTCPCWSGHPKCHPASPLDSCANLNVCFRHLGSSKVQQLLGFRTYRVPDSYKKTSASAGKPILPPSSEQSGHSPPFLSQNLKSPCPSQAVQVGLRLSNSVCKIKKVIAWRGGAGPKPHDSSNLNSSTYKLPRTFWATRAAVLQSLWEFKTESKAAEALSLFFC